MTKDDSSDLTRADYATKVDKMDEITPEDVAPLPPASQETWRERNSTEHSNPMTRQYDSWIESQMSRNY
jgi:hypothetical protein